MAVLGKKFAADAAKSVVELLRYKSINKHLIYILLDLFLLNLIE
jgi:hypothetical protein